MPSRNRQRTPGGGVVPWGKKLQVFERGPSNENPLSCVGYGKKPHPVWGAHFQYHKKVEVSVANPFVSGNQTSVHEAERLQRPTGIPEQSLTASGEVDLKKEQLGPGPDPARPWVLEQRDAYTARSGRGDGAVISRQAPVQPQATWTTQKPRLERPYTSFQSRVEITEKGSQLQRKCRPRPKSASRSVWDSWENNVDKERMHHVVSSLCNRASRVKVGTNLQKKSLLAEREPNARNNNVLEQEARVQANNNMQHEALKDVLRTAPGGQASASRQRSRRRCMSAQPQRSKPLVQQTITAERPLNRTLDVPQKWINGNCVKYSLLEQPNAHTAEIIIP